MLNDCTLLGRLATEPELKYTATGVAVCEFRLAVDRPYKSADGERKADFFTVKVWRDAGELVSQHSAKGCRILVKGSFEQREWVAKDGTKRSTYEMVVNSVRFIDWAGDEAKQGQQGKRPPQQRQAPKSSGQANPPATDEFSDDDYDYSYGDPLAD